MNLGDIVHLNWSPQAGKEMAFPHYEVVLSSSKFNENIPSLIVAPITSKHRKELGFLRVPINTKSGKINGFVCIDQIRSIDPNARKLEPSKYILSQSCLDQCRHVISRILLQ